MQSRKYITFDHWIVCSSGIENLKADSPIRIFHSNGVSNLNSILHSEIVCSSGVENLSKNIMAVIKYLYVYILKCNDGSYYTGVTNDLERRVGEHHQGLNKEAYTFSRRPVNMVFYELFTDYNLAIEWEKRIKNWSVKKKEALIQSNWKELADGSRCKNNTSHSKK